MKYLSDGEADEFSSCAKTPVVTGDDTEHERADQEALNLDPATAEDFNKVDCEKIAWDVSRRGDDQVTVTILQ